MSYIQLIGSLATTVNIPIGHISLWGNAAAHNSFLLCDGTAISRTTYSTLFSTIGTTFGAGNGTTTFNLPDLRQRFPIGKATSGTGSTLGGTGGNIDHLHAVDPPPRISTGPSDVVAVVRDIAGAALFVTVGTNGHTHGTNIPPFDSGTNNPPFQAFNYIIKSTDDAIAYKIYAANMLQSGTAAPVPTILHNTIGSIVWARSSPGQYTGTLTGAFVTNKTHLIISGSADDDAVFQYNSANVFDLFTWNNGGVVSDDVLFHSIEIRVYS